MKEMLQVFAYSLREKARMASDDLENDYISDEYMSLASDLEYVLRTIMSLEEMENEHK